MTESITRDSMQYDVVIVGAGPSGLSAAIKLKQLAEKEWTRNQRLRGGEGFGGRCALACRCHYRSDFFE